MTRGPTDPETGRVRETHPLSVLGCLMLGLIGLVGAYLMAAGMMWTINLFHS